MSDPAGVRVVRRHAVFQVSPGGLQPGEMPFLVQLALFSEGPRFGSIADEELACTGYNRRELTLAPLSTGKGTAALASTAPAVFHLDAAVPVAVTHAGVLHPLGSMIAHVRLLEPCEILGMVRLEFAAGQLRLTFPHQRQVPGGQESVVDVTRR